MLFCLNDLHDINQVSLCTVDTINQNNLGQNACVVLTNGE